MPKGTAPKRRRSPPKISAVEKTALRFMRKLYEATGGQPQRWEALGNLGAVNADAAGMRAGMASLRVTYSEARAALLAKPGDGSPRRFASFR
jgi:hypothetical protein